MTTGETTQEDSERIPGFWTSEHLLNEGPELVDPFSRDQVVSCAYELKLGPEAYVTGGETGKKIFLARNGDQVIIPPGQFGLLLTEEVVSMPDHLIGFISVRYRFKVSGLVNVSGFHVDPGFRGRLIFSVYNAGSSPVPLSRGERVFMLWVAPLEGRSTKTYAGEHGGQMEISNKDIMTLGPTLFSPAALDDRLKNVETRLGVLQEQGLDGRVTKLESTLSAIDRIVIAIAVAAALALGSWAIARFAPGDKVPSPTPSVSATGQGPTTP